MAGTQGRTDSGPCGREAMSSQGSAGSTTSAYDSRETSRSCNSKTPVSAQTTSETSTGGGSCSTTGSFRRGRIVGPRSPGSPLSRESGRSVEDREEKWENAKTSSNGSVRTPGRAGAELGGPGTTAEAGDGGVKKAGKEEHEGSLHFLVFRLADPEAETRVTALRGLQFCVAQNLISVHLFHPFAEPLARNLLEWFNLPSPAHEETVLSILIKLAQDGYMRAQLLEIGAIEFMQQLREDKGEKLLPLVNLLLSALTEWHASAENQQDEPSPPQVCADRIVPLEDGKTFSRPWLDSIAPRQFVASPDGESSYAETQICSPGFQDVGPSLPYIDLEPADNQYLFELNGRLQEIEHPQIVGDALRELRETVVVDFHPEAILQSQPILENVLALLHVLKNTDLVPVALDFLRSLVRRIKAALSLSYEAAFQVHPDAQHVHDHHEQRHATSHGAVYPASVAHSYPVSTKQEINLSRQQPGSFGTSIRLVLYLGRYLHMMTLHLIKLLSEIKYHQAIFEILRELLLLLKPTTDEQFNPKLRTHYMQYFGALNDVVGALGGEFQDLGALCLGSIMQDSEDSTETWQWKCIPVLTVLSYTADLLSLLKPADVVGLLPFKLIKALKALTSNLILAECNFGIHTRILPYIEFFDPDYYHAYCMAHDAYGSIHDAERMVNAGLECLMLRDSGTSSPSKVLEKANIEKLLKCMSQTVPYMKAFEDVNLVRRFISVVLGLLEIEVEKFQTSRDTHRGKLKKMKRHLGMRTDPANSGRRQDLWLVFNTDLENKLAQTGYLLVLLLSHGSGNVRKVAYEALLEVSSAEKARTDEWCALNELGFGDACTEDTQSQTINSPSNCVVSPASILHNVFLRGSRIMSELLTNGIHDAATCKSCAELLLHHVEFLGVHERLQMLPALSWIACSASDMRGCTTVDKVANLLLHAMETKRSSDCVDRISHDAPTAAWTEISFFLRPLFSLSSSARVNAATELLGALQNCCQNDGYVPWWISRSEGCIKRKNPGHYMHDPFRYVLLLEPDKRQRPSPSVKFIDVLKDRGNHQRGSDFLGKRRQKLDDLLDIMKSTSMCATIRRAAVEQLNKLAEDKELFQVMEEDLDLVEVLLYEIVSWMRMTYQQAEESKGKMMDDCTEEENRNAMKSMGEVCLGLLTNLTTSPSAREVARVRNWLTTSPKERIEPLLPLIFHPVTSVRRNIGLILSFLLFSADLLYSDLKKVVSTDDQLFPGFSKQIPYPLTKDVQLFVPVIFTSCYRFPCHAIPVDLRQADEPVPEPLHYDPLVDHMVAQLRLLGGEFKTLAEFYQVKTSIASRVGVSPLELQSLRCISALNADYVIQTLLEHLSYSKDYQDEFRQLVELAAQCSRHPEAAIVLARGNWMVPLERFLTRCPKSEEDMKLLLEVLHVVEIMMSTNCIPSSGIIFLATSCKTTLLPFLADRLSAGLGQSTSQEESSTVDQGDLRLLHLVFNLVLLAENHVDRKLFGRVVTLLLEGTAFLSVLQIIITKIQTAPYSYCILAVQSLSLVAKGMAVNVAGKASTNIFSFMKLSYLEQTRCLDGPRDEGAPNTSMEQDIVQLIVPLIKHMARFYSTDLPSLRHKQLVREIVYCLWCITCSVLPLFWEELWASTSVTYWLSRVVTDHEGTVRGMAFGILAMLASPVTPVTQKMLLKNWPEVGLVAVRAVLNTQECYAVRQEALRFILASNFWTAACKLKVESLTGDGEMQIDFEEIDLFDINTALKKCKFWKAFPVMLTERNGTPGFYRVFLELIRKLSFTDMEFIQEQFVLVPSIFNALLMHLGCPTSDFESSNRATETSAVQSYVTVWEKRCMHSRIQLADRYGVIAQIAEILELMASTRDSTLQERVNSSTTIAALICALCHCALDDEERESSLLSYGTFKGPKQRLLEEQVKPTRKAITEYERAEGVFHVATTLNMLLQQWYARDTAYGPVPPEALPPVSDRSDVSEQSGGDPAASSKEGCSPDLQLKDILSTSGTMICTAVASVLKAYPSVHLLRRAINAVEDDTMQATGGIDDYPLLWRMWLSVSALLATLLSEEEKAEMVLSEEHEACGAVMSGAGAVQQHFAVEICAALVAVLEELFAESRRAKASNDARFLHHLVFILSAVGRALQNILTFSGKAKKFAVQSLVPKKLVKLAHEAHSILAYGYIRSLQAIVRRSRRGRWVVSKQRSVPEKVPQWNSSRHRGIPICSNQEAKAIVKQPGQKQRSCWKDRADEGVRKFRALLFEELLLSIRLLEHLVYKSPEAAEASVGSGVFSLIRSLWDFAHRNEDLLSELLGLLSNLAAQSDQAKVVISKAGLMDSVIDLVLTPSVGMVCYSVGLSLLQTLMTRAEPRARFLHKHWLMGLISQLSECVRRKDVVRQHLLLQLLVNVAAFPHGQTMISKHLSTDAQFDLVLDIVEQGKEPAASSALFLLRNLAFSQDCQMHFVSNQRTIPLLLKSLGTPTPEARAYASSAIWELLFKGNRVISIFKKSASLLLEAEMSARSDLKKLGSFPNKDMTPHNSQFANLVRQIEQSLFAINRLIGEDVVASKDFPGEADELWKKTKELL